MVAYHKLRSQSYTFAGAEGYTLRGWNQLPIHVYEVKQAPFNLGQRTYDSIMFALAVFKVGESRRR